MLFLACSSLSATILERLEAHNLSTGPMNRDLGALLSPSGYSYYRFSWYSFCEVFFYFVIFSSLSKAILSSKADAPTLTNLDFR